MNVKRKSLSKEEIELELMQKRIERMRKWIKYSAILFILFVLFSCIFFYFSYRDYPTLQGFDEGIDPIWSK